MQLDYSASDKLYNNKAIKDNNSQNQVINKEYKHNHLIN
jgi:hypothetical protein